MHYVWDLLGLFAEFLDYDFALAAEDYHGVVGATRRVELCGFGRVGI